MAGGERQNDEEIRCFCRGKQLLGIVKSRRGNTYLHVKVYKNRQIYAEMEMTFGSIKIRCRQCGRWHRVTIVKNKADFHPLNGGPAPVADDATEPVY